MRELTSVSDRKLRSRALKNVLRMGHCAPSIMRTLLQALESDAEWLVKLVAGLPGGIGNTGGECGGVTAPLVLLGLRHGQAEDRGGLPPIVDQGHDLLRRFNARRGTTSCRQIRGKSRVPLRCIGVVRQAPSMCARTLYGDGEPTGALGEEQREAYARVVACWREHDFHCARAVFAELGQAVDARPELSDAVAAFMGGTVLTGMTCSALTAGVMALGLALGTIENSRLRVLRMIARMAVGGDAFADDINEFNRTMNLGHRLARWFAGEHGDTQCRALTGCDFATADGARRYVEDGGVERCRGIARSVARRVEEIIASRRAST